MEKEINPLHLTNELIEIYKRYIFSTTPISDRENELKDEFWKQIDDFCFFNGPFIQYQPTYSRSIHFSNLFDGKDELSIDQRLKSCFNPDDLERSEYRLYTHQAKSIIKAKQEENILIATGTGSGKTECFLLPILEDAIKNPGPGIRSIIIYPMNALANDQLDRLSGMLRHFENDEVTFGRYTGETPWGEKDAEEKYPNYKRIPSERFTREEIRQNPPHILLTNFAMLEYLLIRPKDAGIFAQQQLRYIVLDEAHTYRGAQGIEIALLMRRLREAFPGRKYQFFLTSATFTSDESFSVKKELAEFASRLTGSKFNPENVIFGNLKNPFPKTKKQSYITMDNLSKALADEESLHRWTSIIHEPMILKEKLFTSDLLPTELYKKNNPTYRLLYELLKENKLMKAVYKEIRQKPSTLSEIALNIWGEDSDLHRRVLQWLLVMGSHAKSSPQSAPLLGSRLHIFFRGLEGAFVCLDPNCAEKAEHPHTKWSFFNLRSMRNCPECGSKSFSMEVCWHCGMPVLSIYISDNNWYSYTSPVQTQLQKRMLTWWEGTEIDDSEKKTENDDTDDPVRYAYVCGCGYYTEEEKESCECGKNLIIMRIVETVNEEMDKCPRCGGESGVFSGVTRSFITADDAPTAVLAESAIRNIPEAGNNIGKPAYGKRLLAFSDSRQRAAYFAPYLKRTTCESAYQQPLLDAIKVASKSDGVADFEEISDKYMNISMSSPYVVTWYNTGEENETYEINPVAKAGRKIRRQVKTNCLISLYRHFCNSPRQRNKLTGLGLCNAFIEILEEEKKQLCSSIPELCFENDDYMGAIQILLNIFMHRKTVRFLDPVQSIFVSGVVIDGKFHRSQSQSSGKDHIYRWNPYLARTSRSKKMAILRSRQLKLICKWTKLDPEKNYNELSEILNKIWDTLFDETAPDDSILVDDGYGCRKLNGDRILVEIPDIWFRCMTCGYLVPPAINFQNLCPSADCKGDLKEISSIELDSELKNNHQRWRFKNIPLPLEVKEHTAQLQLRNSRRYQEDFKKGRVNVLSCSTTFEMGVDVGELKVALLRNIPPTPANYIQRAGRVGRRNDGVSYVITFARKLPHDQHFFGNPENIVSGRVNIPYLNLENDILAQRHVNSFLLGLFLRNESYSTLGESIRLKDFFLKENTDRSIASEFPEWMKQNSKRLIEAISNIIPTESHLTPKRAYNQSWESLYSENEGCVFHKNICLTLDDYERQIEELKNEAQMIPDNHQLVSNIYRCINNIEKYKNRFVHERLIDFLSKVGWLPGYAFPQDVIELRILQPDYRDKMSLTRDRDIGISEYAPGTEIIADGKVFKSKGTIGKKSSPGKSLFEPKKYISCNECRILKQFPETTKNFPRQCECGRNFSRPRIYIIPDGFSTSIQDSVLDPRFRRMPPPQNTEIFLVEGARHEDFGECSEVTNAKYAIKKQGILFRANMGYKRKQFRLCMKCGAVIESQSGRDHFNLWGYKCSAGAREIKSVDLAHEFRTDIIQIRLENSPQVYDRIFWVSFLSSFLNGVSRRLHIDPGDLAGLYSRIPDTVSEAELVLYDRIPGGAGYLKRIIDNLKVCFEATLEVVENCKNPACEDLESSCYACLRNYNNQFEWDNLRRKPVIDWLKLYLK